MRAFYFGCVGSSGHHFHATGARQRLWPRGKGYTEAFGIPWPQLDGPLAPDNPNEVEGLALLHYKDGWTALSFADRSIDHRGGSHSTFIFEASLNFEAAVEAAETHFPEVVARYGFAIKLKGSPDKYEQDQADNEARMLRPSPFTEALKGSPDQTKEGS